MKIAIKDGTIIDGTSRAPLPNVVILIENSIRVVIISMENGSFSK